MHSSRLIAGSLTLLVFAACSAAKTEEGNELSRAQVVAPEDTLVGRILFEDDALGRPQSIGLVGDFVLIGDVPRPHALHVIDRTNGEYVASWGREGRGPGEFQRLWKIDPASTRNRAWLYDPSQIRLTEVDLEALVAGQDPFRGIINLVSDQMPLNIVRVGDSLIVSTGLFADGRLARFAADGTFQGTMGPLPPLRSGVPTQVAQHAYEGTLVWNRQDGRFAILTRQADRLEVYAPGGQRLAVHRGPRGFEPIYDVSVRGGTPVMGTGDDLRFGYIDATTAGKHIYALYSGLTRGALPGRANFGGEVHMFDWDGKLVRILPLDHRALALAVTPDERTLYTTRYDPAPAVLQYDLP